MWTTDVGGYKVWWENPHTHKHAHTRTHIPRYCINKLQVAEEIQIDQEKRRDGQMNVH